MENQPNSNLINLDIDNSSKTSNNLIAKDKSILTDKFFKGVYNERCELELL